MATKKAYSYNPDTKVYVGISTADESPLQPGVFILPANSTLTKPMNAPAGKAPFYVGPGWELRDGTPVIPSPDDPQGYPLTARQLRLGLVRNGVSLSMVSNAIDTIPDPVAKDEARVYWEFSTLIYWEHPMTQALMAIAGIPVEQASAMWMVAKDYER